MSTKRDLVEAHSFSRRRLVTAFVSGAPGGREVEPNRPGRMVVGGVGLAVLVVAGGAVMGVLKPRTPDNWLEEDGLVIVKESGARYMVVDGTLHLAENTTSAQLYFRGATNVRQVPQEEIDKQEIGGPLGIYGAPDSPPGPGRLVGTGWSACASGDRMTMYVDDEPQVEQSAEDAAALVTAGDTTWLLAARQGETLRRYEVTSEVDLRTLKVSLEVPLLEAPAVSSRWLDLVPAGAPLSAASFGNGLDPRTADLVSVGGRSYAQTDQRAIALDGFSEAVFASLGNTAEPRAVNALSQDPAASPAGWPTAQPTPFEGDQTCVVLHASPGEPATVSLAAPGDDAEAPTGDLELGAGIGAYVRAADFGASSGGQQFLIDSSGTRYKLGGEGTVSAESLGYDPDDAPTIPASWLESFVCGPELSALAAGKSPDPRSTASCSAS